nr:hypothetical protein [Candidatus Gracilibacteria bacterium]
MKKKYGFTFIELIITVTIVIIIGTIGFMSYSNYISDGRDASRIAHLGELENSFNTYKFKNILPSPDKNIEVRVDGVVAGYQGYLSESILKQIDYTGVEGGKDPKDKIFYTYYSSRDFKSFQLLGFLENESNINEISYIISKTYAGNIDYEDRYPYMVGDKLGILLEQGTNIPVQELLNIKSQGYIDFTGALIGFYDLKIQNNESLNSTGNIIIGDKIKELSNLTNNAVFGTAGTGTCGGEVIDINALITATSQDSSYNWTRSITPGICTWNCKDGYSWDDVTMSCKKACNIPTIDTYNGLSYQIQGNLILFSGLTKTNSGASSFGSSPANGTLIVDFTYTCNDGVLVKVGSAISEAICGLNYTFNGDWNNPVCNPDFRLFICSANPSNSVWNTVSNYSQTWNGSTWLPADSLTAYNTTADTQSCRYICNTGFHTEDSVNCVSDTRNKSCINLPTNALFANNLNAYTISQSWGGGIWSPTDDAIVAGYNSTPTLGTCQWKCSIGYTRSGNSCLPVTIYNCSAKGQFLVSASKYGSCDSNDIIVCSGAGVGYTIPACNIGSNISGTGSASYGNYYQWGNNGGTPSGNVTPSGTLVDASSYGPGNYYNNTTFIGGVSLSSPYDWTYPQNHNLWGDTTNTSDARQGPCLSTYHIPSHQEWVNIVDAGLWGSNGTKMQNDLKLPMGGGRNWANGNMIDQGVYGIYWSSSMGTPGLDDSNSFDLYFDSSSIINGYTTYRAFGLPVRCMKNLDTFSVSGTFGSNASGATINVCGKNVIADLNGNFSTLISQGADCSNIQAIKSGYTCTTTTQGPSTLTTNINNIAGTCTNDYTSCFASGEIKTAVSKYGYCDSNDIIVCSGVGTGYILSSCNLGTNTSGTGSASYGNIFQWGNIAGMTSSTPSTNVQVNTTGYGPGNYYNNSIFIKDNLDWSSNQNDNLWGDTTNTSIARQGSCSIGYHIPSHQEFVNLINAGAWGIDSLKMINDLKLPLAGNRINDTSSFQGMVGYYWSSSPYYSSAGYSLWIDANGGIDPSDMSNRTSGFTLRCFKN